MNKLLFPLTLSFLVANNDVHIQILQKIIMSFKILLINKISKIEIY